MKITRLIMLAASIAIIFALTSCGSKDTITLNIYNWGDYIAEDVIDIFQEETGIKVIYDMFDTNESMYVKIKSGGTKYDIAIPSDYMIEKMVNEDLLYKIDLENVPNYKHIDSKFKNLSYDPDNEYSIPYMWGTVGIVYNKKNIPNPQKSWDILWDEQYAEQILMLDSQRDSIAVALLKLGYDINTRDEAQLNEAKEALKQQKPLVLSYSGDNIKDQMVSEEGNLAVMWSGDAYYVSQLNPDLDFFVPEEGSNYWFDGIVIPKTSQHKKEAEMFIDFLCRPDIALKNTEYIGYTTPNVEAMAQLPSEMRDNHIYSPSSLELERCTLFKDLGDFIKVYDQIWTEALAN